jgi:general secretion pathway protein N
VHARLDARGWVLIAVAGWALLCAIVAMSGFGGRYQLLADDPSQAPALPTVSLASARSPLGPIEAYAEAANRPLFYPDRKPMVVHIAGQNSAAQALNVTLTSIIITPTMQMAIVQDNQTHQSLRVREGQAFEGAYSGWKMVGMTPRSAVFDGGSQGQTTLQLRVFDGHGGEAPTRMGLTPQAIASGALGPPPQPSAAMIGNNANAVPAAMAADVNAGTPSPVVTLVRADIEQTGLTDAANAAAAAAAQQAEQIRQRIEARRQQAQSQGGDTPPPNDKVK